jgi:hypothetical protein
MHEITTKPAYLQQLTSTTFHTEILIANQKRKNLSETFANSAKLLTNHGKEAKQLNFTQGLNKG